MLEKLADLQRRVDAVENQQKTLSDQINENTTITQNIQSNTLELLELFKTVKAGSKAVRFILSIFKWLGGVAIGILTLIYTLESVLRGAKPPH